MKYKKYFRKTSLKQKDVGDFFLEEISKKKPKIFLEIGVFHGVTARNICELLYQIHKDDFRYIKPKLLVEENDSVKLGDPIFFDKLSPEIKWPAIASGKIKMQSEEGVPVRHGWCRLTCLSSPRFTRLPLQQIFIYMTWAKVDERGHVRWPRLP
mgnify:CR=1 FL=1